MRRRTWILRALQYKNMGAVTDYYREFEPGIHRIQDQNSEITTRALRMVLGDLSAGDICMGETSQVSAMVEAPDYIRGVHIRRQDGEFIGRPLGSWYTDREIFCFQESGIYPVRLQQYLECPESFPALWQTHTFRRTLRHFIRTFRSGKLLPHKNLWLDIRENGRFYVKCGKTGKEVPNLSETDRWIFQYLCFLQLHCFWNKLQRHSAFAAPKIPLLIRDFSHRLDAQVNFDDLLQRAKSISEQILVFQ